MEKKPSFDQIKHIRNDLDRFHDTFSVYLSPFRALALARSVAGISAEALSQELDISRSYLASLENYSKPITQTLCTRLLNLYHLEKKNDIAQIFKVYEKIFCDNNIPYFFNIINSIHTSSEHFSLLSNFSTTACIGLLKNICFQTISSYPNFFDITWHDTSFKSTAISTPITWQKDNSIFIPRTILIPPKNLFIAWVAGIISPDKLIYYYKTGEATPLTLVDCRYGFTNTSPLALEGLVAFLLNNIALELHCSHEFASALVGGGKSPLLTMKSKIMISEGKEIILVASNNFKDFYALIEEDISDEEQ